MKDDRNFNREYTAELPYYICLFLIFAIILVCWSVTRENIRDNPLPSARTSLEPAISLRCRDGLFFIENPASGIKRPLRDLDGHGREIQLQCTKAYEAQRSRKMMGYQ